MRNPEASAARCSFGGRSRGFTLLEILVALAVLAIAVASVVSTVGAHVNNAAYLRERTIADWVAMNKFNELQIAGEWPNPGTLNGTSLMAQHDWYWTVTTSSTDDADVRRLDIQVFRKDGDQAPLATFVAYLGRPAEAAAQTQ